MEDRFEQQEQLVLSQDLLNLLEWLLKNHQEGLKNLINQALQRGLADELKRRAVTVCPEDAHYTIIDFLETLEASLADGLHERARSDGAHKKLMPALNKIDISSCSKATIDSSAAVVSAKAVLTSADEAKNELCKELLRRWKPDDNYDDDLIN